MRGAVAEGLWCKKWKITHLGGNATFCHQTHFMWMSLKDGNICLNVSAFASGELGWERLNSPHSPSHGRMFRCRKKPSPTDTPFKSKLNNQTTFRCRGQCHLCIVVASHPLGVRSLGSNPTNAGRKDENENKRPAEKLHLDIYLCTNYLNLLRRLVLSVIIDQYFYLIYFMYLLCPHNREACWTDVSDRLNCGSL